MHIYFYAVSGSILKMLSYCFTLSFLQTNTDTLADSADPDETARHELSHLDIHGLPLFHIRLKLFFQQWTAPNSKMEETTSET